MPWDDQLLSLESKVEIKKVSSMTPSPKHTQTNTHTQRRWARSHKESTGKTQPDQPEDFLVVVMISPLLSVFQALHQRSACLSSLSHSERGVKPCPFLSSPPAQVQKDA